MVTELDETIRQIRTSIFQLRGPMTAEVGTTRSAVLSVVSELEPVLGLRTTGYLRRAGRSRGAGRVRR